MVSSSQEITIPVSPSPSVSAVYAKMLPSIKRHARIAFRYLNPEEKQEAVQNVLANTWDALVGLARRGKLDQAFPSILAKFAEKQTRDHRITGGHLDVKDVLSPYCQAKKNLKVERLDKYDRVNECWYDPEDCCHELLAESRNVTPADLAASRIDFSDWLASLPVAIVALPSTSVLATAPAMPRRSSRFPPAGSVSFVRNSQPTGEIHRR